MNYRYALLLLAAVTSAPAYAEPPANDHSWGHWADQPAASSEQTGAKQAPRTDASSEPSRYGTGIAGSAENLLHQLDESYLLDYQKQLDFPPPGTDIPDEIIGTEMLQGGPQ